MTKGDKVDDFQRYMEMQGVQPLASSRRPVAPVLREAAPQPVLHADDRARATLEDHAYWAKGANARETLEHALSRVKSAENAWMLGIGQGGETISLDKRHNAASLISAADRMKLKLLVMGAPGWSSIFHPGMGAATLDRDPA